MLALMKTRLKNQESSPSFLTPAEKKTYINGVLAAQSSDTSQLSGITSLAIGKSYRGEIGEIVIFTRALKIEESRAIEDYAGKKWTRKILRDSSPTCINGVVTDTNCDNACSTSVVTGVSSPTQVNDGSSGNLTCDSSLGYSGTVSYSCYNGDLHPAGTCSAIACTITSVPGFNDQTSLPFRATATALSSPCASGYAPSTSPVPSYTCTSNIAATITGSCDPSVPANSVAPTLSTGSATVGTSISVSSTGTWSPTPTNYTYQWWWADGTPAAISGATSSSYTPVAGDAGHTLLCKVSAKNGASAFSSAVISNTTSAVANPPVNSVAPALSTTTPGVGNAITVTTGTWSPTPTSYTYQWWWADGTPAAISGATSSSYTPVSADLTHTLLCKVVASASGGTSSAVSSNTSSAVINPPANSLAPALSTTSAKVGTALTVTTGTWSPTPTSYTYQWWWADGTPAAISGATSSSYTPVAADAGHTLLCKVSATVSGVTSLAVSSNTSSATSSYCSGGDESTVTISGTSYKLHTFIATTATKTLTCPTAKTGDVLVVAGGGSGNGGGGGGGGGGNGGTRAYVTHTTPAAGLANTGSGGGANESAIGGTGIVIIRYPM